MSQLTIARIEHILASYKPKPVTDPTLTRAAVLLALGPDADDHRVIFTVRTSRVEHHKGEVSFPGGACDEGDATRAATALRESFEEIGLNPKDVRLLGQLDDFVTRTRFAVTPFVGIYPYPYTFQPHLEEVAEILEVPLAHLLDPKNQTPDPRGVAIPSRPDYRCFQVGPHLIFGATALMLCNFLTLVGAELRPDA
jgi:8-oxo-dGTP pyrophosphatase MutT (NUDIX family)